jgi:hypothetical protein
MSASPRSEIEAAMAVEDEAAVRFLTPEEAWAIFDRAAQRNLGMSGAAFIAAWDAGRFDDDPDRPALIRVAMLRPVGR